MPIQAGELVDRVLQRIRDEHAAGTSRDLVRLVLTHAQRLLNAKLGLVMSSLPLATIAYQCVYPIASVAPDALRVIGVRSGARDLTEVKWQEFWYLKRNWLRVARLQHESFALLGRNMLIIYPARPEPGIVTLQVARLTNALTSDLTDVELPEEFLPLLTDVVGAVALVRQRSFLTLDDVAQSIKSRLAATA